MAEQVVEEAGHSGSTQVFVDDSGRRSRWVRMAGAGVTTLCAAYAAIVVVGLSQTAVGPLITVPSDGNGLVAGFPDTSGGIPGLLATAGTGPAQPVHRAPTPVLRARDAAARDATARDQAARDQAARDQIARDQVARDEGVAARAARTLGSPGTPTSSGSAKSSGSVVDAASGVKGIAARSAATAAAPARRSGSAEDSGRGRTEATSGTAATAVTA